MEKNREIYKLVLLGNRNVGKTCFLNKFTDGIFIEEYLASFGLDFKFKNITLPDTNKIQILQIWDTPGSATFKELLAPQYRLRGMRGVIVMFDCTDREGSFDRVRSWFEEIEQCGPGYQLKRILIATKTDMVTARQVSYEEAKQLADQLGVTYLETSAKNNTNIQETIMNIVRNIKKDDEEESRKAAAAVHPAQNSSNRTFNCSIL